MVKIEWICIVPGCKSNSKAPGHFFPKNPILSQKWKEIVNNNIILNASSEELRKYRICHLHFSPEDYIYSLNRRRLKHDAVPSLNIYNMQIINTEVNNINTTEQHSQSETNTTEKELHLESQENTTELHLQINHESNKSCTSNVICAETNALQNDQNNIASEAVNCPSTSRSSRNILHSITRQSRLTPNAQKIYKKAVILAKQRNRMKRQIIDYKTRLKDAKKLSNSQFCKNFNSLTPTQRMFFNMQLRNTKYSPKVDFKILFDELKSTLKSTCPERSSEYLDNIFFES